MRLARESQRSSEPIFEDGSARHFLGEAGPEFGTPANADVDESDVRSALDRLLSDKRLRLSERNRRFLRFVTEETLAGRAERIKSYAIAVDVFGRSPTFDSVTDPIVRIEATRLRSALAAYYDGPGAAEDVRIELPRGGYVPQFARSEAEAEDGDPGPAENGEAEIKPAARKIPPRFLVLAGFLVAVAVGGTALAGLLGSRPIDPEKSSPVIAIASVQSLSADQHSEEISQGLTQSLISSLSRFPGIKLIHTNAGETPAVPDEGQRPVYILNSSLRANEGDLRFWWSLTDGRTNQTLWSENIDQLRDHEVQLSLEDQIAARVAARIAEPYGIVGPQQFASKSSTGYGYMCVLQARAQQALPQPERHVRIRNCLERTVSFAPQYSDAWAMLALTYLYESRPLADNRRPTADTSAMALEAAERAVQLGPNSGLAYLALLNARFRLGDFAAAEAAAARALELNPNDPDALYAAGIRAYVRGRREEGLREIQKSMELASRARPGAQFILALDAYRQGAYSAAMAKLQEMKTSAYILPSILCAASHAKLGDLNGAQQHVEALRRERPNYAREFRAELAAFHFDEELTGMLVSGGRLAGLDLK